MASQVTSILLVLLYTSAWGAQSEQRFAQLGDFVLENGEVLHDCHIGYRLFGKLNADSSNVVLMPLWFTGTTAQAELMVGPGSFLDPSTYFVIAVDPLGNGISSSPSNSPTQSKTSFPSFTIRDMVKTQYELATQELGFRRIHAVVGASMGGMQALQWMASFPDFMEKAVVITGTPKLSSADLLYWRMRLNAVESQRPNGPEAMRSALTAMALFDGYLLRTPSHWRTSLLPDSVDAFLASQQVIAEILDLDDWESQTRAVLSMDLFAELGGSVHRWTQTAKADLMMVIPTTDLLVDPGPALSLAEEIEAKTLVLDGDCGHHAPLCEADKVLPAMHAFLAGQP